MTKAILFYRNSLLTKVFMLVILLVGGGNSTWATPNIVSGKNIISPWQAKTTTYSSSSTTAIVSHNDGFIGPEKSGASFTTYKWYSFGTSEAITISYGDKILINAKNATGAYSFAELVVRYSEDDKTYTNLADFTTELRSGGAGFSDFTELEVSLSDLTSGNAYYFQIIVKAVLINSASKESASSCTSVSAPEGFTCSANSKTSLTFSWNAATNASSYDVTIYSDFECTNQLATDNVSSTSKEFTGLSSGTTYYCKVQSKGDGSTYCIDGNVTDAIGGTTASKDYTVTAVSNNDSYGTASANDSSLDEGETTTITAVAETGYKFRSWEVTGTGSTLSSDTDNPTTLTMGTVNATVTATFSPLKTYTITYNKGANGDGDAIANGDKTEDVDFTLSSSTYTYSGHKQMGWSITDGGDKVYDLGGTYTANEDLMLYPYWIEQFTITYDKNGGMGYTTPTTDAGEITLRANSFYKTGYSFLGWATSKANADAGIVAYANKAAYTLNADATLYAVWGENYCEMKPATSGSAPSVGNAIAMQPGAFGGTMQYLSVADALAYSSGLQSKSGYNTTLDIELNDYMKPGSIILLTLNNISSAGLPRGYDIYSSDGNSKITSLAFTAAGESTLQYSVVADDGLDGTNGFRLVKTNTNLITLKSLAVTDCQPGGVINAAGWNTYSSNKKLNLSTISGGTAYVASSSGDATVRMKACTDIVNAAEGLMIKGEPGATFTINTTTEGANFVGTNLMVGLPNGGTVSADGGNYVFGWTNAAEPGFYFINSTEPTLGAGKAYLHVDGVVGARLAISFADETPTSINSINNSQELNTNDFYFDLQGRKVKNPTKGLYISNGKKVFVGNKH